MSTEARTAELFTVEDIDARLDAIRSKHNDLTAEVANLDARADQLEPAGYQERRGGLNRALEKLDDEARELTGRRDELRARRDRVAALAGSARNVEAGASFDTPQPRRARPAMPGDEQRDAALRAIENTTAIDAERGDVLDDLIRRDRSGHDAGYLAAVADGDYRSAFGLWLSDPQTCQLRMTDRERAAFNRVGLAMQERAMAEGTGSAGGFGVPLTLDPTIILSSAGSLNPLRQLASIVTITTQQWKGVTSAGVSAAFSAEATQASDNSPTLAQPAIYAEKAQAFVPFSIEVGQDYTGIEGELGRLLADAKDQLEATKYLSGAGHGSNEPTGLLTGLTTTVRVQTETADVTAIDDYYALKAAIPPRFKAAASYLASPDVFDEAYRYVGGGSDEPPILPTREGPLLGSPKFEHSGMSAATTTTGAKVAVGGDFAQFRIVDRVGLTVELVPHLFGADGRPTGQRGLYAYWRTGSGVLAENAFRYLEVA